MKESRSCAAESARSVVRTLMLLTAKVGIIQAFFLLEGLSQWRFLNNSFSLRINKSFRREGRWSSERIAFRYKRDISPTSLSRNIIEVLLLPALLKAGRFKLLLVVEHLDT